MRKLFLLAVFISGCGLMPTSKQYPAFAANPGWCSVMGSSIAMALTSSVPVMGAVTAGAGALCTAEASIVAGPAATVTTTTQTVSATTKGAP